MSLLAQLLTTLGDVQSRLLHLESENSISRRRIRDLEFELEACKDEVVRERTRVLQKEAMLQRRQDAEQAARRGKARAVETLEAHSEKYKEVVEEKKGA